MSRHKFLGLATSALVALCSPVCAVAKASDSPLFSQGKKLLSSGQLREAEPVLKQALAADENNDKIRLQYAICLYQLGRYWGALSHLEKLEGTDKDNSEVWLYLGHCYLKTRKNEEAIKAYSNYIALKPQGDESEKYRTLVSVLRTQLDSSKNKSGPATASGDYMKEATQTGVFSWPDSRIPISVYIEPAETVPGYRGEFDDVIRHAFQEWTTATAGKVKFDIVSKRDDAELIVLWTDDMHAPELRAEAGKASVVQDREGIKSAEVKLLTVSPFHEGPLGCQLLYNVCLHEIGHALGIMGHSPYPEDIMYPQLSTQSGITPRDARTLQVLYAAAHEALAADADKPGSSGENNEFSRLDPKTQAQLLLKAGTQAVFAGQYAESIKKLEKCLKIDPDNELARNNLSVAANNLALQEQSDDDRLMLLHKALFWNPGSDAARVNLSSVLQNKNLNPQSATDRIKFADKLEKEGDSLGACTELYEALRIKPDSAVGERAKTLKARVLETL